ncbi:MAG: hypothetical protein ACRD1U_09600 [Vicinamibacterales bacterium]
MSDVLPAPDGPTSAVIAVRGSSRDTPSRIIVPPRSCVTPRSVKSASAGAGAPDASFDTRSLTGFILARPSLDV